MTSPLLAAPRPERLAQEHPEWRVWLALLEVTAEEATRRVWADAVLPDERPPHRPVLAGATVRLERAVAEAWVRRLFAAADLEPLRDAAARSDALAIIAAAIELDVARFEALATAAGAPPDAFAAVAPLAAVPWLEACGRRWASQGAAGGWCGVCGAWAALAEARGLERERRLRCARCGGDWRTQWLACPFCGNGDHTRLAGLVADALGESRKVEACHDCTRYLKTVTTLSAADAAGLRLLDVATVELDVAALERGFKRPAGLGHRLGVTVAERPARRRFRSR